MSKKDNPLINSHHDLLVSSISLPSCNEIIDYSSYKAPIGENSRVKILWSEEGIASYQDLVSEYLHDLSTRGSKPDSLSCMSILLETTNTILSCAAKQTNNCIDLSSKCKPKPKLNHELVNLRNNVVKLLHQWKQLGPMDTSLEDQLCIARFLYKNKICEVKQSEESMHDGQLSSFHRNPARVFGNIRKNNRSATNPISKLCVGKSTSNCVQEGFHKSLALLKDPDMSHIEKIPQRDVSQVQVYQIIIRFNGT